MVDTDMSTTSEQVRENVNASHVAPSSETVSVRAVTFYLPQFHPIPENSDWWGPGFTEWTNTTRAMALFPGHRQPDLPADLGFYDLRLAESRAAQSELAQRYGIEAFCYWHYWFGAGSRILERPFAEVLSSGQPSIPFCLAWANQSWTGIWHAAPDRMLREQKYLGPEDDQLHFDSLLPAFTDERYLTVDGRPVFYVFRPEQLPNAREFVDRWQKMASTAGLPGLYLVAEMSDLLGAGPRYVSVREDGFDAGVYQRLPARQTRATTLRMRLARKLLRWPEIYPYSADFTESAMTAPWIQPCVYPNWDNTPRAGRGGLVLTGSSPEAFRDNVRQAVGTLSGHRPAERFLWVKSWNEWAEGNHLEPDLRHGHGWLEALRDGGSLVP